jgi:hypothetical protein
MAVDAGRLCMRVDLDRPDVMQGNVGVCPYLVLGGSRLRLVDMSSAHQAVFACGPTFLSCRRVCNLGVEVVNAIWSLNAYREV